MASRNARLRSRVEGVETAIRMYKRISDNRKVISPGTKVAEFKRQLSINKEDPSKFDLYFSHTDGRLEKLEDSDILDDRLQNCALEILPSNVVLQDFHASVEAEFEIEPLGKRPYSWFYQLPDEVRNQRVSQKHCVLLGHAIEDIWPSALILLGFEASHVEIIVHDKRRSPLFPECTTGLIQWIQKFASRATLQALVDTLKVLEEVKTGLINWNTIQYIVMELQNNNKY